MREQLILNAAEFFERQGFIVFCCTGTHACFDVIARRDADLFLLKVLENIDALNSEQAKDLRKIAFMFGAKSLLLGESTKEGRLEDGVLYERQGIPSLSFGTLKGLVEGEFPDSRKFKSLSISVDGSKLSAARREKQYSLEKLASISRISKDTIYRYERGQTGASEDKLERLERILGVDLRKPINPFASPSGSGISDEKTAFSFLGFKSVHAHSAPFEIAAKEKKKLFAGEEADKRTMKKRAKIYSSISEMLDSLPCFLLTESKCDQLEGIPVVRREELKNIRKARELLKLLEERGD